MYQEAQITAASSDNCPTKKMYFPSKTFSHAIFLAYGQLHLCSVTESISHHLTSIFQSEVVQTPSQILHSLIIGREVLILTLYVLLALPDTSLGMN